MIANLPRSCRAVATLVATAACAGAPAIDPIAPEPLTFSIVSTTDVHGHASQMALAGGYVANLRAAEGGRVLWLDGGDMWQGTLLSNHFQGEPMVKVMNAVGVSAAALGNHEFDWGREPLLARAQEAAFPILSANVVKAADNEPPEWTNIAPWTMLVVPGTTPPVKVGVIGLSTLDTPVFQRAGALDDLRFRKLADTVKEWTPKVRAAGADVVVVLAHEGGQCSRFDDPDDLSSCDKDSKLFRLVRALSPRQIDLVIGGHSHRSVAHRVGGVPIIQGGAKARFFARADLSYDPLHRKVTNIHLHRPVAVKEGGSYAGRRAVPSPKAVEALLPFEEEVLRLKDRPIAAAAATPLTRQHMAESELGDLITDALRAAVPGAHVGLQNSGGIRADIDAGPITFGELYDVLPFGNKVATMRLSGEQLMRLLAHGARGSHGLLQVSGVRLRIDARRLRCGDDSHLLSATLESGEAIHPDGAYLVATSDYLAQGGSGWTFLTNALGDGAVEILPTTLRKVTEDHLRRLADAQGGRIDSERHPLVDPQRPRVTTLHADEERPCPKP